MRKSNAAQTGAAVQRLHLIWQDAEKATATISLHASATAQDFARLAPCLLTLADYGRVEKVADLPRKLDTSGAPAGYQPMAGDVCYYAPWGNLAVFLQDFPFAAGLVPLGRIDDSPNAPLGATLARLRQRGTQRVRMERIQHSAPKP